MFAEKDSFARTEWLSMRTRTRKKQHMSQAGLCDNKLIYSGPAITFSLCWWYVQFQGAMLDVLAEISCHIWLNPQKQTQRRTVKVVLTGGTSRNESQPLMQHVCRSWWTIPRNTRHSASGQLQPRSSVYRTRVLIIYLIAVMKTIRMTILRHHP